MAAPATPWLRRLPHRPVARTADAPAAARPVEPEPVQGPTAAPLPAATATRFTRLDPEERAERDERIPPLPGPALTLIPPPGVAVSATLDRDDPAVRFDPVQSGIGVLEIRGAERVAWEDDADRSGVLEPPAAATGDEVPAYGNRPLVGPFGDGLVVGLRHVRRLRRLLVDAPSDTAVVLTAAVGGSVRAADPAARVRVSVVVVDGRLEVRAEHGLPDDWRAALAAMGWSPLAAVPR